MHDYVEFYTGEKLCSSVDFLYASAMCGGNTINKKIDKVADLDQSRRFFIASSIVSLTNLSARHFVGDLPDFEGSYVLDRLTLELLNALRADRAIFVIDYSGETATLDEPVFLEFHRELQRRDIPPRNVLLLNQNYKFAEPYESWCRVMGFEPIMSLAYNHHLYQFSGTVNTIQSEERERRLKSFELQRKYKSARARIYICLNNVARVHRYALASYLSSSFASRGWLSCLGKVEQEYVDSFSRDVLDLMGSRRLGASEFAQFRCAVPLEADEPLATPRGVLAGALGDHNMYMSTFFSFVTESEFDNGASLRVTEKVYKPMANLQPYLLFSSPQVQPLLQRAGFRSLSPVIDESYDAVIDPLERFAKLLELVDWICTRSPKELVDLTEAATETILHNYHWFWDAPKRYTEDAIHGSLRSFATAARE